MRSEKLPKTTSYWRRRLHEIIFEADTPEGKAFDLFVIASIVISVVVIFLESISEVRALYEPTLLSIELFFTILFTIEYVLRLLTVRRPLAYSLSFYGIVDLLAILPTYLSFLFPGAQYLLVIRILRLLRIFRILKLGEYLSAAELLRNALSKSARKISVFLLTVLVLVVIIGSLMYVIEGEQNGFRDIPTSIYWAIVTLTTVGYGDLAPQTALGKILASIVMLIGYGIIAVPTGIVTSELMREKTPSLSTQVCPNCHLQDHEEDAVYCKRCGTLLNESEYAKER
jgi:voltage-gated potassium channel